MMPRLGVLGGTFDPIHYGHLDAADAARSALGLTEILFVPSSDPPHRPSPHASAYHRFAMVAIALDGRPGCRVSDVELVREGRSYTSDTLRRLHESSWQPWQMYFIIGADAFADIASWYEFPGVLDRAHFALVTRPGSRVDTAFASTPELQHRLRTAADVCDVPGRTSVFLVTARTRDVSSTAVRARLVRGHEAADLIPPAVERHIRANQLYQTESDLHDDTETQGA
jgi:nicotinate-nucleotide adenylyltransferase